MYSVKEIFYTLQGEGAHTGRPAVFCRFSGCNLWSGREIDRSSARCTFCDTDFVGVDGVGGGKFTTTTSLAQAINAEWPSESRSQRKYVVFTGGEPLLQLDSPLIYELRAFGFSVAVETNGTVQAPEGIDWISVSPKLGTKLVITRGNELKLVFPQHATHPEEYTGLEFEHFYLQPMDGKNVCKNTQMTIDYCKQHPIWSLSLQTHKLVGIP